MHKRNHDRSNCAMRTAGVTLDHAADLYDVLAPLMTIGMEGRLQHRVLESMNIREPRAILDIGCGTGSLTRLIADLPTQRAGGQTVGIDAAERMIEVARGKAGNRRITFHSALAENLPYPPCSFDLAVSTFFFHHINSELKTRALDEIWRVLHPGGKALILDVDTPYTTFGIICAYSGYILFRQQEIKDNINGMLRLAIASSRFEGSWRIVSRHSGYITLFELTKPMHTMNEGDNK